MRVIPIEKLDCTWQGEFFGISAQELHNIPTIKIELTAHDGWTVTKQESKWVEHEHAEECNGFLISNYECIRCHAWKRDCSRFCPDCGSIMINYGGLTDDDN